MGLQPAQKTSQLSSLFQLTDQSTANWIWDCGKVPPFMQCMVFPHAHASPSKVEAVRDGPCSLALILLPI